MQESKANLIQAKHTRTASAHLSSHIDSALQQLTEQEKLTDTANSLITPEVPYTDIHTFEQQNLCISICVSCAQLTLQSMSSYSQLDVSLAKVKEDMEAAKKQLKAYSVTLTELISKIGELLWYR